MSCDSHIQQPKQRHSDSPPTALHVHAVRWHIHADLQRARTNPLIPPPAGPSLSPGTHPPPEQVGGQGRGVGLQPTARCTQLLPRGFSRRVTQHQQVASFRLIQLKSKLMCCLQTRRCRQHAPRCLMPVRQRQQPTAPGETPHRWAGCRVFWWISWPTWFADR